MQGQNGDLINIAVHHIKNLITDLRWRIEGFSGEARASLNKEQKLQLSEIHDSVLRMNDYVKELLSVSRLESKKFKINKQPVNIALLIKEEIKIAKQSKKKKNCRISLKLPKSKIPLMSMDPDLFRQVIYNILNNALKYSKKDECKINVVLAKKNASSWLITIKDNGIGISKPDQKNIFKKFFRAGNAALLNPQGTGLGLYNAKLIMNKIGGKIWFESTDGAGTTFFVSIQAK